MAEESFPGLNKRHGFFRIIEKNQSDRDSYHWQHEDYKVQKREEVDSKILETREEKRKQRRDRQKPDRQVYTPRKSQSTAYKIDIEIKPNIFWREQIRELGKVDELVDHTAEKYSLDEIVKEFLIHYLKEFEMNLS